jgi:NadR type nicotinamide-nucleotide adenylyltransferase
MAEINKNKFLKIAITGPESTGKTELARQLAEYYGAAWVPEYARSYVETLERPYTYLDVLHIARTQIHEMHKALDQSSGYLFLDTELIITRVWLELVYGYCPEWINSHITNSNIDLYLLCNLDIPWIEDSVRENGGEMRGKLFHIYEQLIMSGGFKYKVITGIGDLRLKNAIEAIKEFESQELV